MEGAAMMHRQALAYSPASSLIRGDTLDVTFIILAFMVTSSNIIVLSVSEGVYLTLL